MTCPRAIEDGRVGWLQKMGLPDVKDDGSCGYCGSVLGDEFMARVEAGTVELGATDKNYKAYLRNSGGPAFKQSYRDCPKGAVCTGPKDCTHWVMRETDQTKFYFQHLSDAQKTRFVELLNERKVKFEGGEYFYVMPYFIASVSNKVAS
jgi:hypothetical protein